MCGARSTCRCVSVTFPMRLHLSPAAAAATKQRCAHSYDFTPCVRSDSSARRPLARNHKSHGGAAVEERRVEKKIAHVSRKKKPVRAKLNGIHARTLNEFRTLDARDTLERENLLPCVLSHRTRRPTTTITQTHRHDRMSSRIIEN